VEDDARVDATRIKQEQTAPETWSKFDKYRKKAD
jgi:hypothetical protein